MFIAVREQGVTVSKSGREYVQNRIGHALESVENHVTKVFVYLSDQNGPRGGEDKRCLVTVNLVAGPPLQVETRGDSLTGIVEGAANKVSHRVHESIRKRTYKLIRALKRLKQTFGRKGDLA
jgi:putative sigma-54 modulation protein